MTRETADSARHRGASDGWPRLDGSPHAVDWAVAIRRETLQRFDDLLRSEAGSLDERGQADLAAIRDLVRAWMLEQTDASFWVVNRAASVPEWFRLATKSDPETRAFVEARSQSS